MKMPALWDAVRATEGDQEITGYVMQVIGTYVELSTDEGERVMVNLELAQWEVLD